MGHPKDDLILLKLMFLMRASAYNSIIEHYRRG